MMALAKPLGVDVWLVKAGGVLLLTLTLMGSAWWIHSTIYNDGYAAAESHYKAVIAEERAELSQADADEQRRQTIANNAAKAREAQAIADLEAEQAANLGRIDIQDSQIS